MVFSTSYRFAQTCAIQCVAFILGRKGGYIRDDGPQIPTPVDPNPQLPFLDNGGCGSYLRDWSNNQGQMTYNWDNNRYEYANGNQVSYNEVYNNYILPHSWFTVYGNDAVNVYSSFRYGDSNTNRALNNIGISVKDAISALPSSLGIMVSLSQEFANANQGNIFITGMDGAETMITTGQLTGGLELASKYSLIGGIGIEAILSLSGNVDARQNLVQIQWYQLHYLQFLQQVVEFQP